MDIPGVRYMGASIQEGIPGLEPKRDLGPGMSHPPPTSVPCLIVLDKFMFTSIWFSTSVFSLLRSGVKMWINSGRKDG